MSSKFCPANPDLKRAFNRKYITKTACYGGGRLAGKRSVGGASSGQN
jgi:hypothetical protein